MMIAMTRLLLLNLCVAAALPLTPAANILIVMPTPARSHSYLFSPLAEELAVRGHNVTYFTAIEYKKSVKNLTQIHVPLEFNEKDVPNFYKTQMSLLARILFMPIFGQRRAEAFLSTKEFQALIKNEGNTFDVVIVEAFVCEAVAAAVKETFKAPLIMYFPAATNYFVNYMVGNEAPTSYVPEIMANLPKKMNFWQRAWNFAVVNFAHAVHQFQHLSLQDALMRKYVSEDLPYIGDIIRNTSLMLAHDHFAISSPRPLVPNLIQIGGVHVKPPKPLPKDLQKVMDESKNGVIFFSLGSNLKSSDMDPEKIEMFLQTFAKLKETIIWKFEKDLPNKPKNVIISDWLPQSDILAHPNLKLFITHGGGLSTTESVDRGVPLVGIPIFADQPENMRQSVNAGVGLSLSYNTLTAKDIHDAIREVIDTLKKILVELTEKTVVFTAKTVKLAGFTVKTTVFTLSLTVYFFQCNPKYKEAAMSRSRQLQDKPMSSLDTAVYWIEYVIRHKGAPHLRSAALDLAWYQVNQLDVVVALIVGALVSLFILKCIVKKVISVCCSKICGKKSEVTKSKKKN